MKTKILSLGALLLSLIFAAPAQAQNQELPEGVALDHVCGMQVNKWESYDWKYKGKRYHFDSYDCREIFKQDPEHFLSKKCIPNKPIIDVVCGTKVDLSESYDLKYKGRVYHFHTMGCKEAFKMNPEKFLRSYCVARVD